MTGLPCRQLLQLTAVGALSWLAGTTDIVAYQKLRLWA